MTARELILTSFPEQEGTLCGSWRSGTHSSLFLLIRYWRPLESWDVQRTSQSSLRPFKCWDVMEGKTWHSQCTEPPTHVLTSFNSWVLGAAFCFLVSFPFCVCVCRGHKHLSKSASSQINRRRWSRAAHLRGETSVEILTFFMVELSTLFCRLA